MSALQDLVPTLPTNVRVYDHGPSFMDRYTIAFPDGSLFTASEDASYFRFAGTKHSIPKPENAIRLDANEIPAPVLEKILYYV
jgi:hypothetical protein